MTLFVIPPPVGGLNARDAIAGMPASDAVTLTDWVPRGTYVETAPPVESYYYPINRIRSLIPYEAGSTARLLAAIETGDGTEQWDLKDITTPGAPSTLKSAQTSGTYVWTVFQSRLILCNGTETAQAFNGTSVTDLVTTGVTASTLRGCITFKGRVYYWQDNAQSFWYAAAGAYQGALTEYRFDTFSSSAGKVTLICSMTRDGGEGADDLFVIVMSTGEILVYQGDDPGSASAWALVGKFNCPRPLGIRGSKRYGRTTLIATREGWIDLNQVLSGDTFPAFSDKVISLTRVEAEPYSVHADMVTAIDMPEISGTMFLPVGVLPTGGAAAVNTPLVIENSTRAWLNYCGHDSSYLAEVTCGCVWQGRTYLAGGMDGPTLGRVQRVRQVTGGAAPVASANWRNISTYGFSFGITFGGTMHTDYVISGLSISGPVVVCSFQTPFGSASGQITMQQDIHDSTLNYWGSITRYRWYRSTLRGKPGGRR